MQVGTLQEKKFQPIVQKIRKNNCLKILNKSTIVHSYAEDALEKLINIDLFFRIGTKLTKQLCDNGRF